MTAHLAPDALAERMTLYREGLGDAEMGRRLGAKQNTITRWRMSRGLPTNPGWKSPLKEADQARRMLLYTLGWSDYAIARDCAVVRSNIQKWRERKNLPANFGRGINQRDNPRPTMRDVMRRIRRAVGNALSRDIVDDATADLFVAVLCGKVPLHEVEASARKYGNRVLDQFASKFGPRSIDEDLPGREGLRMVDMIADERSSSWLEEMGATVW